MRLTPDTDGREGRTLDIESLPKHYRAVAPARPGIRRPSWLTDRRLLTAASAALLTLVLVSAVDFARAAVRTHRVRAASFHETWVRFDDPLLGWSEHELTSYVGPCVGPQTREPEFDSVERYANARPDRFQGQRRWLKWTDPVDPERWVAAFLTGGAVGKTLKNGS